jgi:cytochrome c-type biogenesis protein CcmH/NrfF
MNLVAYNPKLTAGLGMVYGAIVIGEILWYMWRKRENKNKETGLPSESRRTHE